MRENLFTLPEISFVGGETQILRFHLLHKSGHCYDASDVSVDFALCNYSDKECNGVVSYSSNGAGGNPEVITDNEGVGCIVSVTLPAADTAAMYGKYIYQITLTDPEMRTEIPNQGIMYIARNINKNYILNANQPGN